MPQNWRQISKKNFAKFSAVLCLVAVLILRKTRGNCFASFAKLCIVSVCHTPMKQMFCRGDNLPLFTTGNSRKILCSSGVVATEVILHTPSFYLMLLVPCVAFGSIISNFSYQEFSNLLVSVFVDFWWKQLWFILVKSKARSRAMSVEARIVALLCLNEVAMLCFVPKPRWKIECVSICLVV